MTDETAAGTNETDPDAEAPEEEPQPEHGDDTAAEGDDDGA